MEQQLKENFAYVQGLIDIIKSKRAIDIKEISDLQRYIEMQRNILESIYNLKLVENLEESK